MEEERKWCVYCHTNKVNGKKYIGITSTTPNKRWGKNGNKYKGQMFYCSIEKYGWSSFTHEILYSNLTENEASVKEKSLIKKYKTKNPIFGYNVADGGFNFIDNNLGKNGRSKKVICDKKEFSCIKEVSLFYGYKESTMRSMINGNSRMDKKLYKLGLRYSDETIKQRNERIIISNRKTSPTKVICEDFVYNTITDCARYYGVNKTTMFAWLNGNSNMPLNFYMMGLSYLEKNNNKCYSISKENHKSNKDRIKKVIIDDLIFNSTTELNIFLNSKTGVGKYLSWKKDMPKKYYDRGLRYCDESISEMQSRIKVGRNKGEACKKKIVCENIVFKSEQECSESYSVSKNCIFQALKYKRGKWVDRGLRYYNPETDKDLPIYENKEQ